jgi:hypothetical protein
VAEFDPAPPEELLNITIAFATFTVPNHILEKFWKYLVLFCCNFSKYQSSFYFEFLRVI